MLKIGITDENYIRLGGDCYRKMKAHGYSCVDFDMCNTDTDLYAGGEEEFLAKLARKKAQIEEAGLEICQTHGPWRWPPKDGTVEERAERMEKMKLSIRGTALLGCKNWVVHPIMPFGIEDKGTEQEKVTWEMNLTFMRELLATAKEYDVTICLENMPMPGFSIGSPEEILRFVKMIDEEYFKICLDTGHVAVYEGLTPGNALRELGSEVRVLHVHDNDGTRDQHLLPYFGVIDWADFGRAIKETGYSGVFAYETTPPVKLPEAAFAEMNRLMIKLAEEILESGEQRGH